MVYSTTPALEGKTVSSQLGVVTGEAILGANVFKDFFAGIRDIVGGRSAVFEEELQKNPLLHLKKLMYKQKIWVQMESQVLIQIMKLQWQYADGEYQWNSSCSGSILIV